MQNLKTILEMLDIPVAYSHFNTEQNPPCIIYRRESQNNFSADGIVYKKINNMYVELYTEFKDVEMEQRLENLFDEFDIFYNVESEEYIDTEKMYSIIYKVNIEDMEMPVSI